jgi:hypothetical protein
VISVTHCICGAGWGAWQAGSAALKAAALHSNLQHLPILGIGRRKFAEVRKKRRAGRIFLAVNCYKTFSAFFLDGATRRAESVHDHLPLIVVWLQ